MIEQESEGNDRKQKLTLSISVNAIERAKAAGINISAITERLLRAVTYRPSNGNTHGDVAAAYDALFEAIIPILEEYGTTLEVGGIPEYDKSYRYRVILTEQKCFVEDEEKSYPASVDGILHYLYEPTKILQNLVSALIEAAERNREKIWELKMALRFVKALSDDVDLK